MPRHPTPDEILDVFEDVVRRARLAGVSGDRALASMILREMRSRRIKMVLHEFREGEPF